MQPRKRFPRLVTRFALLVALAIVLAATVPTRAQKGGDNQSAAPNFAGGVSTGLISLLPGQSVRVATVTFGGSLINVEFLFVPVNEQGKAQVAILCDEFAAPGDAAFATFTHPGGANRMLMYVQIRVHDNPKDIEKLGPSVEIMDGTSNQPIEVLHGGDFTAFRPIFVP
jgi:hypothetical protein